MIVRKPLVIGTLIVLIAVFALTRPQFHSQTVHKQPAAEFLNPLILKEQQEKARVFKMRKAALQTAIDAYFKKAIEDRLIIGAGVSIVTGDSIILKSGYGKRNVYKSDTVNDQTVFRLGSLSKGFTGILAEIEVKEGNLSWEDKLIDAVPAFGLKDKANAQTITLSNVLSHTTGVPYHCYTNLVEDGLKLQTIADRFKVINTYTKPGLIYSYQNAMFALSGEMMHAATGQTLQALLQNKLFTPLHMNTASTDYEAMITTNNLSLIHI